MTELPPTEDEQGGFMRTIYIALGVFAGLVLLIFAIAVWLSIAFGDGQFGAVVAIIRDVMFIFLALEGMLIVLALVVLIAQVARLVNLVQNEIKPILKNTQETVQHARGTVEFVGKNLAEPVMTANKFAAGATAFAREIFRIRRIVQPTTTSVEVAAVDDKEEGETSDS